MANGDAERTIRHSLLERPPGRNPRAPATPSADRPRCPIALCRASKGLKMLKTTRASYWLKLASIWDRRHVRLGSTPPRLESSLRRSPLPRERIAGIDLPALEPGRQPLLAHRGRAVGETVGHGIAAGGGLQTVVADRSRGGERFLEIVVGELPVLVGVVGEDASEAIGHQFDPHRKRVGLRARNALLGVLDLAEI